MATGTSSDSSESSADTLAETAATDDSPVADDTTSTAAGGSTGDAEDVTTGSPVGGDASGCCTEYCDTSSAPGGCLGAAGGQECVAWYDEGQAPPGYANVGACIVP